MADSHDAEPPVEPPVVPVAAPVPIACTLTADRAVDQLDEWAELRRAVTRRDQIADGVRLHFSAEMFDTVDDLARREAACCSFLSLVSRRNGDAVVLDITTADPAARPVIELLTGTR